MSNTRHFKQTKRYIQQTKALGRSSIYNIIGNTEMGMNEKIAFIRHNYVYYDGNYDLFYNEDNTPKELRIMLDETIEDIITGKTSPDVLTSLNKEILKINRHSMKQYHKFDQLELAEFNYQQKSCNHNPFILTLN